MLYLQVTEAGLFQVVKALHGDCDDVKGQHMVQVCRLYFTTFKCST